MDSDIETREFADLSAFRRDLLIVISGMETPKGLEIKEELESYYEDLINHGRLYPNLDSLSESGFIEKVSLDARSNGYTLTERGAAHLQARSEWEHQRLGEFTPDETVSVPEGTSPEVTDTDSKADPVPKDPEPPTEEVEANTEQNADQADSQENSNPQGDGDSDEGPDILDQIEADFENFRDNLDE